MKKDFILRIVLAVFVFTIVYQFGIRPVLNRELFLNKLKSDNWAKSKLAVGAGEYDVIVVGEEPDGIAAAVAAARTGARTLLISGSEDLGGAIVRGLDNKMSPVLAHKGELLSRGFFWELKDKLGEEFSVQSYLELVNNLIKAEKELEVVYNTKKLSPVLKGNTITGIRAYINGKEQSFSGKRIIDSTKNGVILASSGTPYTVGSEDLNLKKSFLPVRLNFAMEGVKAKSVKEVIKLYREKFYELLDKYDPVNSEVRIRDFDVRESGDNCVVVSGIEVLDVDVESEKECNEAYSEAVEEAKSFSDFLKSELEVFRNAKFVKSADELIIPESRHYLGEHILSVNEILENTDFDDKIALGSSPVEGSKFVNNQRSYIIGKPEQYSIPIGCIIPQKVENLLMTGGKISYSSLASTSANDMAVNIMTGQAAGIAAVYSIVKNVSLVKLLKEKNEVAIKEMQKYMKRQGVYLPKIIIENKKESAWCYRQIKVLTAYGLIAGGMNNNFMLDREAKQQDLGYILLNGVYRVSSDKYNYEFDSRVRSYLNENRLTKEKVGEILLAFHGRDNPSKDSYSMACKLDYIDELAQLRLKDKEVLSLDMVYYLGANNIKLYTGKNIFE